MTHPVCSRCVVHTDDAIQLKTGLPADGSFHCSRVHFNTGETIFKENAIASGVVYLKSGLVKIHTCNLAKDRILRLTKAPSYLCLPSSLGDTVNRFTATALEPTTACFIDLASFKKLIYENGDFAYQIIMALSRREMDSFHVSLNLAQKQANGRVADALLYLSRDIFENNTFTIPFSRQELGDWIGVTRESVSRILAEFNATGIIGQEGRDVTILNNDLLEQISAKG
jgi:CRP/FNR family transcriptional regulator